MKKYKPASKNILELKPIHENKNIINYNVNIVHNVDINSETITNLETNIVYLDPPYNQRQYSKNYHPLNFVINYDFNSIPYGVSGMIENTNISKYCSKSQVKKNFNELIQNLKTEHILLSYNDEGLMDSNIIKEILIKKGKTNKIIIKKEVLDELK